MPAIAVVGAQWGDEGKGKVVDFLAARARGTSFGAPTELETMLARLITSALPSKELISDNGGKDYVERK